MLFFVYCIRLNKYRFNYGRQANRTLASLLIPSSIPNDWNITDLTSYSDLEIAPIYTKQIRLDTRSWTYFPLIDLFNITGTTTTAVGDLKNFGPGNYPYVTTQASHNGIDGLYDHYTEDGGVITVDSAVLGYAAYQAYNFSASDHVEKLIPLFKLNKYNALFLCTILNREKYRYNYGRKASQDRLRSAKILLPSTQDNKPDFDFMEKYIKSLHFSKNL